MKQKKSTKNCAQKIYRDKLKQQQEHDQKECKRQMREKAMYEKQRERDKRYIRRPKKNRSKKIQLLLRKRDRKQTRSSLQLRL